MPHLPHQADRLHPAEDFFHAFPPPLPRGIAGVDGRASLNRARAVLVVLRHVRSGAASPAPGLGVF